MDEVFENIHSCNSNSEIMETREEKHNHNKKENEKDMKKR